MSQATESSSSSCLVEGEIIDERWKIMNKIGSGGFGAIFRALDLDAREYVAIKVEPLSQFKQVLKMEIHVLKKISGKSHFCRLIGCGRNNRYSFAAMTLQGPNLSMLRRQRPRAAFSMSTTLRVSLQILKCIQTLHESGFLHRDIKPSNFTVGRLQHTSKMVYILDFGLCRQFLTKSGKLRVPRSNVAFRGTVRYASLSIHHGIEMGPHDDLWSLFYMMIEFSIGSLPWRKLKDKDDVAKMKESYDWNKIFARLPVEFEQFYAYISTLTYHDTPDYAYVASLFDNCIKRKKIIFNESYDWEEVAEENEHTSSKDSINAKLLLDKRCPEILNRRIPITSSTNKDLPNSALFRDGVASVIKQSNIQNGDTVQILQKEEHKRSTLGVVCENDDFDNFPQIHKENGRVEDKGRKNDASKSRKPGVAFYIPEEIWKENSCYQDPRREEQEEVINGKKVVITTLEKDEGDNEDAQCVEFSLAIENNSITSKVHFDTNACANHQLTRVTLADKEDDDDDDLAGIGEEVQDDEDELKKRKQFLANSTNNGACFRNSKKGENGTSNPARNIRRLQLSNSAHVKSVKDLCGGISKIFINANTIPSNNNTNGIALSPQPKSVERLSEDECVDEVQKSKKVLMNGGSSNDGKKEHNPLTYTKCYIYKTKPMKYLIPTTATNTNNNNSNNNNPSPPPSSFNLATSIQQHTSLPYHFRSESHQSSPQKYHHSSYLLPQSSSSRIKESSRVSHTPSHLINRISDSSFLSKSILTPHASKFGESPSPYYSSYLSGSSNLHTSNQKTHTGYPYKTSLISHFNSPIATSDMSKLKQQHYNPTPSSYSRIPLSSPLKYQHHTPISASSQYTPSQSLYRYPHYQYSVPQHNHHDHHF